MFAIKSESFIKVNKCVLFSTLVIDRHEADRQVLIEENVTSNPINNVEEVLISELDGLIVEFLLFF